MNQQTITLVGGCPRSGTTGLADALTAHPDVAITQERYSNRAARPGFSRAHFAAERIADMKDGDGLPTTLGHPTTAAAIEKWDRAPVIGDKIPDLKNLLKGARALRDCKVIVILREPFGMAFSAQARIDDPEDDFDVTYEKAVKVFNSGLAALREVRPRRDGFELHVVEYDAFLEDPEVLDAMFEFLGVDPSKGDGPKAMQREKGHELLPRARLGSYVSRHADFDTFRRITERSRLSRQDSRTRPDRLSSIRRAFTARRFFGEAK